MSTPASLPSAPLSRTPSSHISPAPSKFLLSFTNPSAAAQHNTTLKLKGLLAKPELAANIRAELCPNGFTLGDLFHVVSWSQNKSNRMWKGLALGAKEQTLYNLVRLLAPACNLPDSSEVTKNEISAWVKGIQRAQTEYVKDLARLANKSNRGAAVDRYSNQTFLQVVQGRGAQLLSFKGAQDKLDLQQGKATSTPPPRRCIADVIANEGISPAICPALAELTNSSPPAPEDADLVQTPSSPISAVTPGSEHRSSPSPAASLPAGEQALLPAEPLAAGSGSDGVIPCTDSANNTAEPDVEAAKENGNPQASRRDVEAAKKLTAAKERKLREAIDTAAMLTEQRHACDMSKMKALVDLNASEKVPPP